MKKQQPITTHIYLGRGTVIDKTLLKDLDASGYDYALKNAESIILKQKETEKGE
jgi:hypothetical protein